MTWHRASSKACENITDQSIGFKFTHGPIDINCQVCITVRRGGPKLLNYWGCYVRLQQNHATRLQQNPSQPASCRALEYQHCVETKPILVSIYIYIYTYISLSFISILLFAPSFVRPCASVSPFCYFCFVLSPVLSLSRSLFLSFSLCVFPSLSLS